MFGQATQTSNTLGGGFGSSGTGSGHQRTITSLFAPASGTPSTGMFGSTSAPASTASTTTLVGTGSFGGNPGFGSTTAGFGGTTNNTTTSTTGGTGLFGSTISTAGSTNPTSSFSFNNTNTTVNTGFGGTTGFKLGTPSNTTTTTTTNAQPSLGFGTKPAFSGTTSLFGNQQQPQQQQQPDSLLSLHASFPDTNVPHFIVKPDKVTRTAIPPSLFNKDDQSNKAVQHEVVATTTTKAYGEQRSTLPGFLTSATAPSSKPGQKRAFEGQAESERRTLHKQSSSHSGVFGMVGDETFSDSKSRAAKEVDAPPMASLWDIGVNPRKYSSSLETPKSTNKPDLWSLAVMQPTQTVSGTGTGKTSSLARETNNSLLINSSTSSSTAKGPTIVKVFGYPSEMKVAVIDYFSRCGKIEERYQSVGNWMTFRYASSEAAKEALENHGKIVARDCMVGVVEAKSMTG